MRKILAFLLVSVIIFAVGCSANKETEVTASTPSEEIIAEKIEGSFANVDVEEAQKLIDQGITIIDVRTLPEYAEGHIPNSSLIPLQDLETRLGEFSPDDQYLIVCRSGNRSAQASEILVQNGITNVYNMTGGMNEWTGEVVTE